MSMKWLFQPSRRAAEQPHQSTKSVTPDQFTFTWKVKDYHEIADLYPTGRWFYSDSFAEPNHQLKDVGIDSFDYLWRMCMYPNGVSPNDSNYLGLFLKAIPTDFERDGNSSGRERTYAFEVYRVESSSSLSSAADAPTPVLLKNEKFSKTRFGFGSDQVFGRRQFLKLSEVYSDPTSKFDLIVRVRITNEESTTLESFFDLPASSFDSPPSSFDLPQVEFPLALQIPRYFDDERFCDVEFTFTSGQRIRAHRIILASQSKYFESLLSGQWVESRNKTIPIKEIDFEIFRCVIYYLYTGKLEENLELDTFKAAYMKADMLGLEPFGRLLASRIAEHVNNDNWDEILMMGWQMGDTALKSAALGFLTARWDELKGTENMQRVLNCGNIDWIEELMAAKMFGVNESNRKYRKLTVLY